MLCRLVALWIVVCLPKNVRSTFGARRCGSLLYIPFARFLFLSLLILISWLSISFPSLSCFLAFLLSCFLAFLLSSPSLFLLSLPSSLPTSLLTYLLCLPFLYIYSKQINNIYILLFRLCVYTRACEERGKIVHKKRAAKKAAPFVIKKST